MIAALAGDSGPNPSKTKSRSERSFALEDVRRKPMHACRILKHMRSGFVLSAMDVRLCGW